MIQKVVLLVPPNASPHPLPNLYSSVSIKFVHIPFSSKLFLAFQRAWMTIFGLSRAWTAYYVSKSICRCRPSSNSPKTDATSRSWEFFAAVDSWSSCSTWFLDKHQSKLNAIAEENRGAKRRQQYTLMDVDASRSCHENSLPSLQHAFKRKKIMSLTDPLSFINWLAHSLYAKLTISSITFSK